MKESQHKPKRSNRGASAPGAAGVLMMAGRKGKTMTSEEMKEVIDIMAEYALTGLLLIDERQRQLMKKYSEIMSN